MALEILLPNAERPAVEAMIQGGATPLDVAKKYLVPVAMVNTYLSEDYKKYMIYTETFAPPCPATEPVVQI